MKLKIMTFNTQHCFNYINKEIDIDAVAQAIKEQNADIVGLNEMRAKGVCDTYLDQVKIIAEKLGYYYYFAKAYEFEGGGPYGNGIVSRYPIISAKTVIIPDPEVRLNPDGYYETRCMLKAKIDAGDGLNVIITHFGLNRDEHENAAKTFLNIAEDKKCIFMGDFNVKPDSDILLPIREKMKDTADAFKSKLLSFPSDKPEVKIDYIFITDDIKLYDADIPAVVVSDHRPYIANIEI